MTGLPTPPAAAFASHLFLHQSIRLRRIYPRRRPWDQFRSHRRLPILNDNYVGGGIGNLYNNTSQNAATSTRSLTGTAQGGTSIMSNGTAHHRQQLRHTDYIAALID